MITCEGIVRDGALWGAGNGARGSRLARRTPYAGGGMNGRRWIQAGGAAMALILFAAVLVWFVYDQSSRRIPTAQVVVPESPSAPDRAGGRELLAPYTDAAPPAPAPPTPPRPMRWIASPQPAVMTMPGEPPLELERRRGENQRADGGRIVLSSGFECSAPLAVSRRSPSHFVIDFDSGFVNWFMFRLEGVAQQVVRVDFTNVHSHKWWSLNPVYAYTKDVTRPDLFKAPPTLNLRAVELAWNGPSLPDTSLQAWHFIPNVWAEGNTLSFVHRFTGNVVYVAMKVPYSPSYQLGARANTDGFGAARVVVGHSLLGRPLELFRMSNGNADDPLRPCILVYAREHGTEADSSFVAEGLIEFLESEDPRARRIRDQFTYLVIPILDPDGAALCKYDRITRSFALRHASDEAAVYATWFLEWLARGNRIDLILNLHNVESAELEHLTCIYASPTHAQACRALHSAISQELLNDGPFWRVGRDVRSGRLDSRLCGWLGELANCPYMLYEVNSQERHRHLSIAELRGLGRVIALGVTSYLQEHFDSGRPESTGAKRTQPRPSARGASTAATALIRASTDRQYSSWYCGLPYRVDVVTATCEYRGPEWGRLFGFSAGGL